jgi:hypothetical protein
MFAKKVVLTKRIRWFEDSNGSPSFNHCWMIWDRQHRGPPTLAYASEKTAKSMSAIWGAGSIDQRNTACSLSAGVSKPKVFRGR